MAGKKMVMEPASEAKEEHAAMRKMGRKMPPNRPVRRPKRSTRR